MNGLPKSQGALTCFSLAALGLIGVIIFTFVTLASGTAQISGRTPNCGTGKDTDMGCYLSNEASQRGQIADRDANTKVGMTFTFGCGVTSLALAAMGIVLAANRAPGKWAQASAAAQPNVGGTAGPPQHPGTSPYLGQHAAQPGQRSSQPGYYSGQPGQQPGQSGQGSQA